MKFLLPMILLLGLSGCGAKNDVAPPPPIDPLKPIAFYVFSAPWCESCIHEVPKTRDLILKAGKKYSDHAVMWMVSGVSASSKPTEEILLAYQGKMAWPMQAKVDPWRWTTYKQFFPSQNSIPAAVAVQDGKAVATFGPGDIAQQIEVWFATQH